MMYDFRDEVIQGTEVSLCLFWTARFGENYLWCCEDTQAACRETHKATNWSLQPTATWKRILRPHQAPGRLQPWLICNPMKNPELEPFS